MYFCNKVTLFLPPPRIIPVRFGGDLIDTICWMSRIRNNGNFVTNAHLSVQCAACTDAGGRGGKWHQANSSNLWSIATSIWFLFIYCFGLKWGIIVGLLKCWTKLIINDSLLIITIIHSLSPYVMIIMSKYCLPIFLMDDDYTWILRI